MNIRELIEWRKNCYLCQNELHIFPSIGGLTAEYSFKDNVLSVRGTQFLMQIDMENGKISCPPHQKDISQKFLATSYLNLQMKCVCCRPNTKYSYSGRVVKMALGDEFVAKVTVLSEYVRLGDLGLTQDHLMYSDAYVMNRAKTALRIPIIDLNKVAPDKLENKLKTLLTFS